ncbi:aldolase/citrate lyase family protein [Bordetella sp. 2513F-2]
MPQTNIFKQALRAGTPQIGLWSTLSSPFVTELIAGAGFDWIMLDTEHAPSDVTTLWRQLQAVGCDPQHQPSAVVRPAWNDAVMIKRYLDLGAQTLLIPFVQNADEARAAVAAMRYPPHGVRGMGGATRASRYGRDTAYAQQAEEQLCLLVQAETEEALARIEEIAAVDGVDGIFVGPGDLSASMGLHGQVTHPRVNAAVDDAIARIRACGKAPGILMADEARARACLDQGALFVAVATDLVLLRQSADAAAARYRTPAAGHAPAVSDSTRY